MKKSRRSVEQIIRILREGDSGQSVEDICRAHNISTQSFYRWKSKYGSMDLSEAQRLRDWRDYYNKVWACFLNIILGGGIIAGSLLVFLFWVRRFNSTLALRRDCNLGFLGERAVGEELNLLLADGWRFFHDIEFDENPGSKPFNVDHVVVGTGGIFAIETKTRRKLIKKSKDDPSNIVTFDGSSLSYPWGVESFGVKQARERAEYLSQWFTRKLQTPCPVIPVLALPGWFVNRTAQSGLRVVSGHEICFLFRGEHTKSVIDLSTVKAVIGLLDQKCRDVGK